MLMGMDNAERREALERLVDGLNGEFGPADPELVEYLRNVTQAPDDELPEAIGNAILSVRGVDGPVVADINDVDAMVDAVMDAVLEKAKPHAAVSILSKLMAEWSEFEVWPEGDGWVRVDGSADLTVGEAALLTEVRSKL